ncbi:hypothetical protein AB0B45_07405 [Nonomuraea sp. NPDC049152]|uniref:hypothetical protein n=1 Tax=Nonomuraea sp. NPDC049152 TaxID=3154350 RepID=UPI00340F9563
MFSQVIDVIDVVGLALSTVLVGAGLYMVVTNRAIRLLPYWRSVDNPRVQGWACMLIAASFPLMIATQELELPYEVRTIMLGVYLVCLVSGTGMIAWNSRAKIRHDGIDR